MSSVPCSRLMAPARLARLLLMEQRIYILMCQIVYYLAGRGGPQGPHYEYGYYEYGYGWAVLMPLSRPK